MSRRSWSTRTRTAGTTTTGLSTFPPSAQSSGSNTEHSQHQGQMLLSATPLTVSPPSPLLSPGCLVRRRGGPSGTWAGPSARRRWPSSSSSSTAGLTSSTRTPVPPGCRGSSSEPQGQSGTLQWSGAHIKIIQCSC